MIRPDRESILVMLPIQDPILAMHQSATMPKKMHCCTMLAQIKQTMVKMNTTMSLTAIDKRLMMK
jgi:hypothetical protein